MGSLCLKGASGTAQGHEIFFTTSGVLRPDHSAAPELGLHCLHLSLEQVSRREKRHVRILTSRLLGKTRNSKGMAMLAGYQKTLTRFSIYHALLADLMVKRQ